MSDEKEMMQGQENEISFADFFAAVKESIKLLVVFPLVCGLAAFGFSFLVKPTFTAETSFLPPQQQQSAAAAMLQGLGSLGGMAGAASGLKNPADQYVAFIRSRSVNDALVRRFDLQARYGVGLHEDATRALESKVRVAAGRDGLVRVEVDDVSPEFAAQLANAHVDELRNLLSRLAVTEAQQRRAFYEKQLEQAKAKLAQAQEDLQGSGIQEGALRAEPRMAAETYAKLKAEVTSAQVRIQAMRSYFSEHSPEFKLAQSNLRALSDQLKRTEAANQGSTDGGYFAKYREFKYQEVLFEMYAKQFELAKLDEAREGAIIQVVDVAQPPQRKAKPRRASYAVLATFVAGFIALVFVVTRVVLRNVRL